jgi:hypothetical protein
MNLLDANGHPLRRAIGFGRSLEPDTITGGCDVIGAWEESVSINPQRLDEIRRGFERYARNGPPSEAMLRRLLDPSRGISAIRPGLATVPRDEENLNDSAGDT